MFSILSYFRRADGLRRVSPISKREKEKKVRNVSKERNAVPTLSGFVRVAARGLSRSTADNYRTAVRSFVRFNSGRDVPLSALDAETLRRYERWLREGGVCPNTSSCYMRSLRAIYNKAAAKRLVKDRAPFKGLFTGNERTVKRSIGAEEMRRLVLTPFPPPCGGGKEKEAAPAPGASALDLFLFSFYAMGMPFTDLAHLRKRQVKDGVLTYRRRKTGRQVRVKLEKCMLEILGRYKAEGTDYLFPILYKVKDGRICPVSYPCALNRYNRSLKQLARQAGIGVNLTSYVARHSWASIAYEHGVGLPVISKALGHTDTKTTLIYIEGIKDERLAEANRELLERIRA
ncbi:recombinase [Bacteroides heparinolyticus]|uniref:tyrosine-type recombinase/integrase n=1 Tax=Prevotella heparinolytica TaxID=28113 RepID=UPI000D0330DA|nr:site-specific integrase [Bacteroides heparinolyticus]AVM58613.1 recombinase [Bacteroides heparinolyticus]